MRERARKWIAGNASQWVAGYDKRQFEEVMADFAASERLLALEECAKIAEGETVDAEDSGSQEDVAYNNACKHIATAIRSLAEEK